LDFIFGADFWEFINAQIAAGYAFTLRLRCGDAFLRYAYGFRN
jgi:hypothetical protein